jgi:hypothetical protein
MPTASVPAAANQPQLTALTQRGLDGFGSGNSSAVDSGPVLFPLFEEWDRAALELERQLERLC